MSIELDKRESISLEKAAGGRTLTKVTVGLGWVARKRTLGPDFDLDASVLVLDEDDRALNEQWFVFYGNLVSPKRAVVHQGDELQGGDGSKDDEQIVINLDDLPIEAAKIILPVTIYKATERKQNFGQVKGAFIRILDERNTELLRYDLREESSSEDGVIFGALTRESGGWQFQAIGESFEGGLRQLCQEAGIGVR